MINPTIKQRLDELEPSYRDFVLSDFPTTIAESFAEAHNFDDIKTVVLENGIVLFLLFFFDKQDLTNFIVSDCELNEKEASLLTTAIIMALPKEIKTAHEQTRDLVFKDKNTNPTDEILSTAEAEALAHTTSPLRTMEGDSTQETPKPPEEKTYTVNQSDLLENR
jgi:hypothetical protein